MDKTHAQQSSSKTSRPQKTHVTQTRTSEKPTHFQEVPNGNPFGGFSAADRLTAPQLLQLQQTHGNRAVGRLIQAKLTIGRPDDQYEREADRVADTVMRMSEPTPEEEETPVQTKTLAESITPLVQRAPQEETVDEEPMVQRIPETEEDKRVLQGPHEAFEGPLEEDEPVIRRVPQVEEDEEQTIRQMPMAEEEESAIAMKPLIQRMPETEMEEGEEVVAPKLEDAQVQRQVESEEEPELQAKHLPARSTRLMPKPVRLPTHSARPQIQRVCTECEAEMQRQPESEEERLQTKPVLNQQFVVRTPAIQPKGDRGSTPQVSSATAANINSLKGGGSPLPRSTRSFFEPRFAADFSQVRVHTGVAAERSARDVNAYAYTVGHNIVFGAGRFAPGTHEGRRLIAHELTHVVQQSGEDGMSVGRSKDKRGLSPIIQGAIAQQSIQRTPLCPNKRDSGEAIKSRSPTGILVVDTSFDAVKERLAVQDFGIDQDRVPPTMTQSDDWRRMMSMILGDPTSQVAVFGYSDCFGTEQNNQRLRDRRADAVVKAMPAKAQAKVLSIFKGSWISVTYLFPNDTAKNRARNRMVLVALVRDINAPCDRLSKATNIDQYIFLVSCLEKRLGLTNAADAPKTLSLLRQLYFGNAPWTTQRNRSKLWDNIITTQPWTPGNDPTPKLGTKLFNALQASKEVKSDSSTSSTSFEISHFLTGLDAMRNPQAIQIPIFRRHHLQTNVFNHALATWGGDVASAATNYTICVDFLKFSASYDDFFKNLAEDADLEGDIDAYAAWAALNWAPNAPVPLQLNLPISEVLMQYYRLKNTRGGQARAKRFEVFANYYGANVKGQKMQNRKRFKYNILTSVLEIALLLLGKQMKELLLQRNMASIGNCAGGKPPAQTGQPVSAIKLVYRMRVASAEMTERFTIWLERRL